MAFITNSSVIRASVIAQLLKKSAYSAGKPSLIPGLGRAVEEGRVYPLQYSRASIVAQLVKNPPAMWETWVQSPGWEDLPEKGTATHTSILPWRITWIHSIISLVIARTSTHCCT